MSILDNVNAYNKNFKYEFDNDIMLRYYPKRIISKMKKGKLLELGLGHGYTIQEFLNHTDRYTIIDGSREVIDNFIKNNPDLAKKVDIIESFFENFETDEKYNYIVMGFVLEHVLDPDLIVSKFKRFLAKTGKLFITVPNATSLHRQIGHHAKVLDDLKKLSESDLLLGHRRYFDINDLKKLAKNSNLNIVNIEGIFLKPFTTGQLMSLNLDDNAINGLLEVGKNYPELSNAIMMELSCG